MTQTRVRRTGILLALFLSGFAGLMHEIVWARLLANLIGNTAHAQAVVLAVFMGGLAAGAVLFGRRSDARAAPLLTYVRLEIAVGVYCLFLPLLVKVAGAGYDSLAAAVFDSPGEKLGLRLALALLVVLTPAVLMGGTLPVLARFLIGKLAETRAQVASLYALNNLGAVVGAGIAGFYMLPAFGIYPSLAVASALNFAAAGFVWRSHRELGAIPAPRAQPEVEPAPAAAPIAPIATDVTDAIEATPEAAVATRAAAHVAFTPAQRSAVLIALALSGFAAMGYEVVFTRIIALSFGSSAHSFTVMLMAFITGIGLGSAYLALRRDVARPLWMFGASQIAVVIALAAVTPMIARLPYWIGLLRVGLSPMESGYGLYQAGKAALILLVLAAPTICIGFGFPLAAQIHARTLEGVGRSIGATYAWNTVGNVLGVVVTSLALIPMLGIRNSFEVLLALNLVAGACVLLASTEVAAARKLVTVGASLVVLGLYGAFGRGWSESINYAVDHLRMREGPDRNASEAARKAHPTSSFDSWRATFVSRPNKWKEFFFEEEADTTVLACGRDREVLLYVNGKGDASTGIYDMVTQLLLGHLPLFLEPDAKDVLVIGLGSGVTAGSAMLHQVEHMDVVEISSGVLEAERLFSKYNHAVLKNPKVTTWRDDARTFLRTVPRHYDVIISEPSNPWIAGIGNLFTTEFFESGRDRLNPGGVMCIWFHQYEQSDEALALVLRTVGSVFPQVTMFLSYSGDVIAVASMQPLTPDFAKMEARFDETDVRQDLARVGIFNLAMLLTHHAASPSRFPSIAPPGPLNRDLHQRLEYLAGRGLFAGRDATLISHCNGFAPAADGLTDGLLDAYIQWRKAQNDPVTREELEPAAAWVKRMLVDDDHRLVMFVRERAKLGVERTTPSTSASRGGTIPLAEMNMVEASNRARERVNSGQNEAAIPLYRRALEADPGNAQVTFELGNLLLGLERVDEVLALVQTSLAAHPDSADVKVMAAMLYARSDRMDDAKRACIEVLAVDPKHVTALTLLGNLYDVGGEVQKAVPLYEQAIALDAKQWQAALRLSMILRDNPTTAMYARQVLENAIAANPEQNQLLELREQFQ